MKYAAWLNSSHSIILHIEVLLPKSRKDPFSMPLIEIRAVASRARHSNNQINRESSQQSYDRQFSEEKHVMTEALRGLLHTWKLSS
jgi:hypothetical protein